MPKRSKGFTLVELLVVISIIGILATIGLTTFNYSQMKGRDTKRKTHLAQVADALEIYYNDKGKYPGSSSGRIVGCGTLAVPTTCEWGESFKTDKTTYMIELPEDPSSNLKYIYVSAANSLSYQLYARLENPKDDSIIEGIIYYCDDGSTKECNYGISSANTTP